MIDVHSHVVPDALPFGAGKGGRWPSVEIDGDVGRVVIAGRVFRTVRRTSWDLKERLEDLDRDGVRLQVLSPMPELFSYWAAPRAAEVFCREMNGWLADAVGEHPGRYRGLGTVPLQDPNLACTMLAEVAGAGLSGVEIGTNVEGRSIADRQYRTFFQEAARLDLAVFIHAFQPRARDQAPPGRIGAAVTFPLEIGFCVLALVANGVLEACPRGRIGVSHGGGAACYTMARLERTWERTGALRETLPHPPRWYLRRLYYDTLLFGVEPLQYLLDIVGPGQVFVGSDYPFVKDRPGWNVADPIDAELQRLLLTDNAARFLKVAPP